ncbi:MAG: Rnase Y domain-containing protein, partial [Myxococcota bacterium]|nr:Rnase Y domain-containing protein [Myxococcota bacterium]
MTIEIIAVGVLGAVVGGALVFASTRHGEQKQREKLALEQRRKLEELQEKSQARLKQREEALQAEFDALEAQQAQERQLEERALKERESQLSQQEKQITKREKDLHRREKDISRRGRQLDRQEESLSTQEAAAQEELEQIAGLSPEGAREKLMAQIEAEARRESVDQLLRLEEQVRASAEAQARSLICSAVQRYAGEHISEHSVIAVELPTEELKGRVIGRAGRNIHAFSDAAGCDLIVDDTPGVVLISSFNPVRREIARIALERLLKDGRINAARIEEVIARAKGEVTARCHQLGEAAALELEISGLSPQILRELGRLHFATRFAQNLLQHSVEVAFIAGQLSAELGLDPRPARRAGLLHDIGHALDENHDGDHASAGAQFCKKHGERSVIVEAIRAHRDPNLQRSLIAQIVAAANQLSTSRPGARRGALAKQIRRVETLESIAQSFAEVERC